MQQRLVHRLRTLYDQYGFTLHLALSLLFAYAVLDFVLDRRVWNDLPLDGRGRESRKASADWVNRASAAYPPEWSDDGPRLRATHLQPAGDRTAILEQAGHRFPVRAGDLLEGGIRVVTIGPGRLTLSSPAGTGVMTLPSAGAEPPVSTRPSSAPRIDLARKLALEILPRVDWQSVPLRGNFAALRVAHPVPYEAADVFGVAPGDIVEIVNGLPFGAGHEYEHLEARFREDEVVSLGIRRGSRRMLVMVNLYD